MILSKKKKVHQRAHHYTLSTTKSTTKYFSSALHDTEFSVKYGTLPHRFPGEANTFTVSGAWEPEKTWRLQMAIVASMINMKGGVGKSTLAFNLGWYSVWYGKLRVLCIVPGLPGKLEPVFLGS